MSTAIVLPLPLVLPFVVAILAFLFRKGPEGRWISVGGSFLHLIAGGLLFAQVWANGPVATQMGGWPAPFGITLVADTLSAVMVVITGITALAVSIYAVAEIDEGVEELGYHALFQVLIAGVTGAFLTGDLFNLYVWFEVMLISSFGLLIMGGSKVQMDAGIKYVTLNLISTILFLSAIGLLYGATGTLNLADLRGAVATADPGVMTIVAGLFLVGFGIKAGVFPLFFWLPASYHTPSFAVSAVFAGLLTKVGVYALIRMFTLIFVHDVGFTHSVMLWIAVLTMVVGVLGAAAQAEMRRILSFHIVSQIGYMVLGLALLTPFAMVGAVFYLVHHIIVKANLFLVAGVAGRISGNTVLAKTGGLYAGAPFLAFLFLVPAFSLAGFPPLSGFWAKYVLLKASMDVSAWLVAFAVLAVGLMTIYSMTKIWGQAFWKPHPDGTTPTLSSLETGERLCLILPIVFLATLTIVIGLYPQPFIAIAERAADELLDPTPYLEAVFGAATPPDAPEVTE